LGVVSLAPTARNVGSVDVRPVKSRLRFSLWR
jgi:hypothetical protein